MANRKELRDARRKAAEAVRVAEEIAQLPRRKGQKVVWGNGVIWERVGDDQWMPTSVAGVEGERAYSSAHIADFFWRPYDEYDESVTPQS